MPACSLGLEPIGVSAVSLWPVSRISKLPSELNLDAKTVSWCGSLWVLLSLEPCESGQSSQSKPKSQPSPELSKDSG